MLRKRYTTSEETGSESFSLGEEVMPELLKTEHRTYRLGSIELIPIGEGRLFHLPDREVAVFRTRGGQVYATDPRCPHRTGPLADGLVGERLVICPLHAYKFDLVTGRPAGNDCPPIQTYPVTVTGDGELAVEVPG